MATARHFVRIPEKGQPFVKVPRLTGEVDEVPLKVWRTLTGDGGGVVLSGRAGRLGDTVYATPDFPESAVELLP